MEPIDYNSTLGVSKREWIKVLGVNLALLLIAYTVALIFTLCGSKVFLLNYNNAQIESIEKIIRYGSFNFFPLIEIALATLETCVMASYIKRKILKWYYFILLFGVKATLNIVLTLCNITMPAFLPTLINAIFIIIICILCIFKDKWWKVTLRALIVISVSLMLNVGIAVFRMKWTEFFLTGFPMSVDFVLSIEYELALVLALGFLTLAIKWEKGEESCKKNPVAGGSSPTMRKWSPKNSQTKNNLSPKIKRKFLILKAKVIVIQTVALAVIASLLWFTGRPVEFTLLYLAFCLTRMVLGFSHSLHFKSELSCVTIGALTFWGLTYLSPSAEVSIIMSLVYGAGLALGFRLYWQLHDLIMYRKAAKTDRYAMFYTAFKGNIDPRHIRGVMRMRGFPEDEIKMVQMYMGKDKIEYIAKWLNMPLRSVDRRLTEIAEELYERR